MLVSKQLNATQLFEALRRSETADPAQTASSVFQIEGDSSIRVYRQYAGQVVEGFLSARRILAGDKGELLERLLAQLMGLAASVEQLRVLPLATSQFAAIVPSWPLDRLLKTSEVELLLDNLKQLLCGALFDRQALLEAIKKALTRCDVPYFYFQPDAGRNAWYLMCDERQLAATDFYSKDKLRSTLRANLLWLLSEEPLRELREKL